MSQTFEERLNCILPRLVSQELLHNFGLGNEIGFYIFDYPPEKELQMRAFLDVVIDHLPKQKPGIRFKHVNLFEMVVEYLKDRRLLDRAVQLQKKDGDNALLKALKGPLGADQLAKVFASKASPAEHDLILVSGVGSVFPMLRSHTLLNNLHPLMGNTPLVMFYPGVYTGQGLRLFGRLPQDNYYRAFRLVA